MRGFVTSSLLLTALGASGCSLAAHDRSEEASRTATTKQALPGPIPGVDIVAQRAFVGDPLRGIGAGQPGNLYDLASDDAAPMASTTKSFTLLLAAEAVESGVVSLDDIVTISPKAANIDNNHQGAGHSEAGFPAGEQVRFEDLLYALMIPSGGDAAIAIAQHVAVSTYPELALGSTDASQEAAFVGMMNQRAEALGLTNTKFFNPYGGDHAHFDDNTPGGLVPHEASTRDMARWFQIGMQHPLFRTVAGFQGTYAFNAVDGTPYSFNQTFGYPGVRAQKGGSNVGCLTCGVADARRIGRDLLLAFTQGQTGDGTTLLDYGFAELFHPIPKATGPSYTKGWSKNSLACVTSQRAASAVVKPNGTLEILLWGLNLDAGSIEHLNAIVTPWGGPGGVVRSGTSDPSRTFTVTTTDPDPEPPTTLSRTDLDSGSGGRGPTGSGDLLYGGPKPVITDARIQYAGNGNLMVVAETTLGVYLYSYGITQDDTVILRDLEYVGDGTDARVQVLNSTLIVTAHRTGAGNATLKTWRLSPFTGKLDNPLATNAGLPVGAGEMELAARPGSSSKVHVVLGFRSAGGSRILRSYEVVHQTGAISPKDSTSFSGGTHLALTRVPGFDDRDIYALAFRDALGRVSIESYEYATDGSLTRLAQTTDTLQLLAEAPLAIAAYGEGGVMVASQPSPNAASQELQVWALDASGTTSAITPNLVTNQTFVEDGLHGMCRVPNNVAEGDFLVATGKDGVEGIRLRAFRSGPRQ